MAKSGQQPSQTSTYNPSPEQAAILRLAMPGIRNFAAKVPERYPGSTVAGFDPAQTQGQEMALTGASSQQTLAGGAMNDNLFMMGDIWNPASNPNLQGAIDASVRPITQRYQEVVKPGIRDEFQAAGQQFGGSPRGKAEARAASDYMQAVGDTSSKLVQDQYGNNLNANLKALALLPQTQAAQVAPALTTSGVGDVRQALSQAFLNANVSGFNYDQMAPFLQSKELISLLQGLPGASVTSTANVPQPNQMTSALGGAMSGASLGSTFGPWGMAGGAGLGALLSFL